MERIKRIFIKIHENGVFEILVQDPGVAVLIQYPDEDASMNWQKRRDNQGDLPRGSLN